MSLICLMEMLCDWIAATKRTKNSNILKSIEENQKRFGYSDELKDILEPPNKTANMSIIASDKNTTEGHQLRHQYISRLMTSSDPTLALTVDIFGKGYNPVEHKIEALRDYRFSVAIENCRMASYFTEKLIDCFAAHTVPVYWGCPTLKKFFNTDGIIAVDSLDELVKYTSIISENGKEIYSKRSVQTAIKENFELAKKYKVAEDWIYENVLKPRELV
jgi:hypothetical protein